jgi:hypothetical protein
VFRDIDNIPPGVDFRRHIERVLDESDIVLVIIGPRWVGPDHEQCRLSSPADPVRIEIEAALQKNKPLIPVLVSRAVIPPLEALPDSLHDFAYRTAAQVDSGQDFDFHVRRLIRAIENLPRREPPNAEPAVAPAASSINRLVHGRHIVRWALALGVVVMLGAICVGGWRAVEQQAEANEKERAEEQARQVAAAKAQVEDALNKGNPEALDSGVYAKAIPSYRMAADQGNADAQELMGWFYENGRGVSQDYDEAMRWHRKAADQGDPHGQVAVGLLYENGRAYHRTTPWRCAGTVGRPIRATATRKISLGPYT